MLVGEVHGHLLWQPQEPHLLFKLASNFIPSRKPHPARAEGLGTL